MAGGTRQQLVDGHTRFVHGLAGKVRRELRGAIPADDLVGYGMVGLLEAAERFDGRQGVLFTTFAYHRVRGAIYDGLRKMGQLKRSDLDRVKAAERANEYLRNLAERDEGAAAAGAAPPAPEEDLKAMYDALAAVAVTQVVSLDALTEARGEFVGETPAIEEAIAARQVGAGVRRAMADLPEKERHFIQKFYFEGKTLNDAGQELGLSRSWACRLHARAINLLRDRLGID